MSFLTDLVHSPYQGDHNTGAVVPPIYTATTYAFKDVDGPERFDYSRSGNPTRQALEDQVAKLEAGHAAFAFASGMAAIHGALAIFEKGDHIIVGQQIYGGTFRLIYNYFLRWGLEVTAVDTRKPEEIRAAIRANTKAIYFEPLTNPLLQVTSVKQIAALAQKYGLLTIVDNTFLTPYLQQPLKLGADIVIHSATKYLSGHSDVSAGIVVVKDSYLAKRVYFNQNALGGILSPQDANLVRRGIQTLALRMDRQIANTQAIITFLKTRPEITQINYPYQPDQAGFDIIQAESKGLGALFSFELATSVDVAKFVSSLKLINLAVSLGAVETLIELPYKMSHAELSDAELATAGISKQLIRLAVGIEDVQDLIADLTQALDIACQK